MPTDAREKRPEETVPLGADFTGRLPPGDTLVSGNTEIKVYNAVTDAETTSTIFDAGSKVVSGNVLSGKFWAGADGELHTIHFLTGLTSLGNSYRKLVNLSITDVPAGDDLLANRDELKRALGIEESDTSDDTRLDEVLLAASAYFRSRTARSFTFGLRTDRFYIPDLEDNGFLFLREYPVLTVERIVMTDAGGTELADIDDQSTYRWDWDRDAGKLFFLDGSRFPYEPGFSDITYRAGYGVIPADIRSAVIDLASWMRQTQQQLGLSSEKIGDYLYKVQNLDELPKHLKASLPVLTLESTIKAHRRVELMYTV